jgi:TonB family protein
VQGISIAASVVVHAAIAGVMMWAAMRALEGGGEGGKLAGPPERGAPADTVEVELTSEGQGQSQTERASVVPSREPPHPQGGDVLARLDTGAVGRGGDAFESLPALNLADGDERLRLSPDPLDRLDRDQLQRLHVAQDRASWEDRRSTTHPTELTLVVTGLGTVLERRSPAENMPGRGALASPANRALGGEVGSSNVQPSAEGAGARPGGAHEGTAVGAPGVGIATGRPGDEQRMAAPIGSARPDVQQAPVAVPANDVARPKDDVDSDQEVATSDQAMVHASTAGGERGEGQGGVGGGGEPGAGGSRGPGSHARPLGVGESDVLDYWTSDPRLLAYFRLLHAKLDPLWANAFPKSALLELKQGTVILEFTIAADGRATVSWPPLRPSGIDEFDRNCADAIRRASPFPPIPASLGVRSLHVRAPFAALNPIVK